MNILNTSGEVIFKSDEILRNAVKKAVFKGDVSLENAKLSLVDLSGLDLSDTNFNGADLTGCNLRNSFMCNSIGNGREIISLQMTYNVVLTPYSISIGSSQWNIAEFLLLCNDDIIKIGDDTLLGFYHKHQFMITEMWREEFLENEKYEF
jgi:hypothetical protein